MRYAIYKTEFMKSLLMAFPKKGGGVVSKGHEYWQRYACKMCHSPSFAVGLTLVGRPTSLYTRKVVYDHLLLHESPKMTFEEMTERGKRLWLSERLGLKSVLEGVELEELNWLSKVVNGRA